METVAYLGPGTASFSHAALEAFRTRFSIPPDAVARPYESHAAIHRAMQRGDVDHGVLAFENAIAGVVDETARLLVDSATATDRLRVVGEVAVPVALRLMAHTTNLSAVRCIASHDMALRQCSHLIQRLREANPDLQFLRCDSTAAAAELAAADPRVAAIASPSASARHGLVELVGPAENRQTNQTRFLLVSRAAVAKPIPPETPCKSLVLLELERNRTGLLAAALECFSRWGISLSLIHSCSRLNRDWEYTHLLEYEERADAPAMQHALWDLTVRGLCRPRVLGSYRNVTTALQEAGSASPGRKYTEVRGAAGNGFNQRRRTTWTSV